MLTKINNSNLYIGKEYTKLSEGSYYHYIYDLIKKILNSHNININILFSKNTYNFYNTNNTIIINSNYEHTIRKNILRVLKENFIIKIDDLNVFKKSNIIIDYSIPNIYHVSLNRSYYKITNKHIYIAPSLINDISFSKENRNIYCLTTFINTNQPRRNKLLNNLKNNNINHININNCWGIENLEKLYKNTKILINIHQTDYLFTFEEFRVLPALQCGCIVICEDSPYSDKIPYKDYIIWSSYNNIIEKTKDVINRYDYYHNLIFVNRKDNILHDLNDINYKTLENKILELSYKNQNNIIKEIKTRKQNINIIGRRRR